MCIDALVNWKEINHVSEELLCFHMNCNMEDDRSRLSRILVKVVTLSYELQFCTYYREQINGFFMIFSVDVTLFKTHQKSHC
jgi:hypothetical protein